MNQLKFKAGHSLYILRHSYPLLLLTLGRVLSPPLPTYPETLQVPRAPTLSTKSARHFTVSHRNEGRGNAHGFTLSTRNFHQLPRAHLFGTNPTCQLTFSHNDKTNPNPTRKKECTQSHSSPTPPNCPWTALPNLQTRHTPPRTT